MENPKKRKRKEVEYVRLSHGRRMKKSTYDWMQKKNEGADTMIWLFVGFGIFLALVKGCN